ncbi:hypothetical protein [Mycolicibacterium sphagni]|uniref:Restriction endonuclease type IV Mrr domain-containing protein n=1 Tax=Mycolicibacterium sphagni TaxID=1786 RepID=A0ABX2JJV6_9MYCO|nr:hypothetical protein [Mycolicibacterium sphagni]NTY57953.1 hypothetical protein [Mycolicibacterium sphagni]
MAKRDEPLRMDETHKRLLDWTYGQPPSERLAALILDDEGYRDIDPSHPLGGPDGGRDGHCTRDGEEGVWAVYFPRGQQSLKDIGDKLVADIDAARKHDPEFLVFVTNQEIRHSERTSLRALGGEIRIELLHLERVGTNLDRQRMAAVREQFLKIPATPVSDDPSIDLRVSLVGTAHMFTDDNKVLNHWVAIREKEIRKKSEQGHARLRAEQEKKERAEAERRAQQARQAAEKARETRMEPFPGRFGGSAIEMPWGGDFLRDSKIFDAVTMEQAVPDFISRMRGIQGVEVPQPPEPLSEEEIASRVAAYRTTLESRWPSCRDYLAGVGWDGMHIRIKNEAKSFLTDVEVILTFRGARGVDHEGLDDFELMKVQDPAWEPPRDPLYYTAIPAMARFRSKDFPIEWRDNDDGDLEVTITLARLRPLSEWRSEDYGDEVVLVVDPGADIDEVSVTFTATARTHDDVFEGAPLTVPVEKISMLDKLLAVMEATKDTSDD